MSVTGKLPHKWLAYGGCALLFYILQTMVLSRFQIAGVYPMLLPVVIACVALFEGPEAGSLFGLAAGLFWCFSGGAKNGMYVFLFTVSGALAGLAGARVFARSFKSALLWSVITLLITEGMVFLFRLAVGQLELSALWTVLLPETAYSLIFSPAVYWLVHKIHGRG